jgi:hypothetical protein
MVAAVLLLIGTGLLVVGLRGHEAPLVLPAARHAAGPSSLRATALATPSATVSPLATPSMPVALRIPAIRVTVSLSTLGLNPDGTVEVPTDFRQPGWFRLGPTPGQVGSAVILGHVDNHQGPAVFYQLRSLMAGDKVDVRLANGMTARFAVTSVAMYPKQQFPAQQVYGSHGFSALQLVTCGGTFDARTGSYLSNVVVYTSLVATIPATGGA